MGGNNTVGGVGQFKHLQYDDGEENAAHASYGCEQDALTNDLREDAARCGSDGASNSYLDGSLFDGDHHDVRNTNGSGKKGAYTDKPDEEVDATKETVEHSEHHLGIEDGDGLFVVGVYVVASCKHLLDARGNGAHSDTGTCCSTDEVDVITEVIGLLHERDGNDDALLSRTIDIHISVVVIHTYHAIIGGVDADELPTWVATSWEERLVDFLSDDADLSALCHIEIVEETAIIDFWRFNFCIVGQKTFHVAIATVFGKCDCRAPFGEHG